MIAKIISGFNKMISFLGNLFSGLFDFLGNLFSGLFDLLEKPLSLIFYFFDGVFYFITTLADIVIKVVMIFVAMFQFVGALVAGVYRQITWFLNVDITPDTNFPSVTHEGFKVVIDLLQGTGMLTVVPMVATAFLWFFFVIKLIGLSGGQIMISPYGRR